MWFEAPESTNHTSSGLRALFEVEADIEFALCFIMNIPPRSELRAYIVPVHSGILFVVGIVSVVRELLACGSRFPHFLLAFFFVVAEFSPISTLGSDQNGSSPFFRRFLDGSHLAAKIGSCFRESDLDRLVLG